MTFNTWQVMIARIDRIYMTGKYTHTVFLSIIIEELKNIITNVLLKLVICAVHLFLHFWVYFPILNTLLH